MTIVDIEIQTTHIKKLTKFVKKTSKAIAKGYGGGNCTPESVAFWSLYPKEDPQPGTTLVHIELVGENNSDQSIAAAVAKVTQDPTGQIEMFGNIVGTWTITSYT